MATVISLGWAKPDDPIYKSGTVIGGKRFYNSSKADKKQKQKPKPKEKK